MLWMTNAFTYPESLHHKDSGIGGCYYHTLSLSFFPYINKRVGQHSMIFVVYHYSSCSTPKEVMRVVS